MPKIARRGRRSARLAFVAIAVAAAMVAVAPAAFAHVTASPETAEADNHATLTFSVPHGCEGSPTTAVSVQIPDGVVSVTPEFIPDWDVETQTGQLSEPVELHGEEITEGVTEVTWSGGPAIPDDQFFEFGLSVRLPDQAGETLYFPVVQTCEEGETGWIQIPEEGQSADDLEEPAPAVTLTAAQGGSGSEQENAADEAAQSAGDETTLTAGQQADEGAEPLTMAALGVAILGLLTGIGAFITARRRA